MSISRIFFGFWKIVDAFSESREHNAKDIIGTEFQLTSTGNVIWKTPKNIENFPLLSFKIYVVHKSSCEPYYILKFATLRGFIVECDIETIKSKGVLIFYDGWCTYTCKKIYIYGEYPVDIPFNFLPALENSYFSDLVITASNKKKFLVHKCILKYAAPKLDWLVDPPPLSGYSEDVINTILHFLYGECLPKGVTERTLNDVMSLAKDLPGMESLISLCIFQSENLAFKNRIIDLVSDIDICITKMRDIFTNPITRPKIFNYDFDEIYFAVKKSLQEGAGAIAKLLVVCKTYANGRTKLSEEDDLEILHHILSKIPKFISTLKEYSKHLMSLIRKMHSYTEYWEPFMSFLLPKVQNIFDIISSILVKIGESSGAITAAFQDHFDDCYVNNHFEDIDYPTDSDFDKSPMAALLFASKDFKMLVFHFERERRLFNRTDLNSKIRLISLAIEEFLKEVGHFKGAFKDFTEFLDNQTVKGKIYFGMKIIALKANDLLNKLVARRTSLVDLLVHLCDIIGSDPFFECMLELGFLDPLQSTTESGEKKQENYTFPALESACKSPPTYLSRLSQVGYQLLESQDLDDMVFEVIYSKEILDNVGLLQNDSDESNSDSSDSEARTKDKSSPDRFLVKAHRTIVSSRCEWFKLALVSGMKEDINRKIEIHITPSLFSLFFEFLYTGQMSRSEITIDDYYKILLLSDRYNYEHLKEVCEFNLKKFIDELTVFILYNVADECNADKLKSYCEDFIGENPAVVETDRFKELSSILKREAMICSKGHSAKTLYLTAILCNDSFDTLEDSLSMLRKRLSGMGVQATDYEKTISMLRPKLEKVFAQINEKIGFEVPRKALIRTILDADYDVDRAIILYNLRNQKS